MAPSVARIALSAPTIDSKLKVGMALCWLSIALLPVRLMGVAGGPCAGPRNADGSAILLVVGFAAVAGSIYRGVRILRFFRVAQLRTKLLGILSLLCGCFATFVGGIYLLIGGISLPAFMQ